MLLRNLIIAIIIMSMIVISMAGILQSLNEGYGTNIDAGFNETYNNLETMVNLTNDISNKTQGSDITTADAFETMSSGALGSLKLTYSAVPTLNNMIQDMLIDVGIPTYIWQGFLAILTVLISFIIISAIFRHVI